MGAERHVRALEAAVKGPMTLGETVERMHESGFGLVLVFVCLPFLQPLPLAGLSTVIGAFIALQGVQLARGRATLWLPRWIARRRLEERTLHSLLGFARRFFSVADRLTRPRLVALARAERAAGAGIAVCGVFLALPFPIPLSNMICALPVALLSLALLEDDGVLAALGWLGVFLMIGFHFGLVVLGADGVRALWGAVRS